MANLHSSRFRLTPDNRLEVYDHKLATRLNRYLKSYDEGRYTFQPGEEALFNLSQIEAIEVLSNFLTKKRAQPADPLPTAGVTHA